MEEDHSPVAVIVAVATHIRAEVKVWVALRPHETLVVEHYVANVAVVGDRRRHLYRHAVVVGRSTPLFSFSFCNK